MFDFDDFERELDAQNAALEAMLDDMDIAEEGLFKPRSLDQMLAKVQKQVNKKCKTSEDCDDLLAKLKSEENKFNSALQTMKDAATQYKEDGDKKALKAAIGPASKDLKKTCDLINLGDVVNDKKDVTDEDIKKLHDFLVGTRKIINDRKASLSEATEVMLDMDYMDMYMDTAMEAEDKAAAKKGGAFQNLKRVLATQCHKMSAFCIRHAKAEKIDANKGFWMKMHNFFKGCEQKLVKNLSDDQLKKMQEAINKNIEKSQEKADAKKAKANNKELNKYYKKEGLNGGYVQNGKVYQNESWTDYDENLSSAVCEQCLTAIREANEDYVTACLEADLEVEMGNVACESFEDVMDYATEALSDVVSPDIIRTWRMKHGQVNKQCSKTLKEARKAIKSKDYDKAISLIKAAKKGYSSLLTSAKKLPDKVVGGGTINGDVYRRDTYKSITKANALNWVNAQISKCDDLLEKIQDRQAKAAAKASESYLDDDFLLDDAMDAMESAMDPFDGFDDAFGDSDDFLESLFD